MSNFGTHLDQINLFISELSLLPSIVIDEASSSFLSILELSFGTDRAKLYLVNDEL